MSECERNNEKRRNFMFRNDCSGLSSSKTKVSFLNLSHPVVLLKEFWLPQHESDSHQLPLAMLYTMDRANCVGMKVFVVMINFAKVVSRELRNHGISTLNCSRCDNVALSQPALTCEVLGYFNAFLPVCSTFRVDRMIKFIFLQETIEQEQFAVIIVVPFVVIGAVCLRRFDQLLLVHVSHMLMIVLIDCSWFFVLAQHGVRLLLLMAVVQCFRHNQTSNSRQRVAIKKRFSWHWIGLGLQKDRDQRSNLLNQSMQRKSKKVNNKKWNHSSSDTHLIT